MSTLTPTRPKPSAASSCDRPAASGGCALWLLAAVVLLATGCGGEGERRRLLTAVDEASVEHVSTPELEQSDARLASIEQRTRELEDRVDALQDKIAVKMGPALTAKVDAAEAGRVLMEVDRNSVLRVNGIVMSRTEYTKYVEKQGKTFCTPTPSVTVDPAANYDTVSWVLETAYNIGCATIDIDEKPAEL